MFFGYKFSILSYKNSLGKKKIKKISSANVYAGAKLLMRMFPNSSFNTNNTLHLFLCVTTGKYSSEVSNGNAILMYSMLWRIHAKLTTHHSLTYFMPKLSFFTPWKHHKPEVNHKLTAS